MTHDDVNLDASTFQKPLAQLAEVLAQKLRREAPALLGSIPRYVSEDLHVLMRQATYTYHLLFYINADERRENDPFWRLQYTVVTLPLIRNMIDCLYNITFILENPACNGSWFRKSGFHKTIAALDRDEQKYKGHPDWVGWIHKVREYTHLQMRSSGLTLADVQSQQPWPTLGKYIRKQTGGTLTPHQHFLNTFTYGHWQEYSAMAHGAFEGLLKAGPFYVIDAMPHDDRDKADDLHPRMLAEHLGRAAGILLCIVTEVQAYFHFEGADINARIHKVWDALLPLFDVKELYEERYAQLMRDKRIHAVAQ